MSQCLKITFMGDVPKSFLKNIVQKNARTLELEGVAQFIETNRIKIIICGQKDAIDKFVDVLHKELAEKIIEQLEIEPFIKDKSYRGVFRVIE